MLSIFTYIIRDIICCCRSLAVWACCGFFVLFIVLLINPDASLEDALLVIAFGAALYALLIACVLAFAQFSFYREVWEFKRKPLKEVYLLVKQTASPHYPETHDTEAIGLTKVQTTHFFDRAKPLRSHCASRIGGLFYQCEKISQPEYETYRDLHGLPVFVSSIRRFLDDDDPTRVEYEFETHDDIVILGIE